MMRFIRGGAVADYLLPWEKQCNCERMLYTQTQKYTMRSLMGKLIAAALIVGLALFTALTAAPQTAHTATVSSNVSGSNLTELVILSELFGDDGGGLFDGDGDDGNLVELILLQELFVDGRFSTGNGNGTTLGLGGSNLTELVILSELFGDDGGNVFNGDGDSNFGRLIILNELFLDGSGQVVVVESGDTLSEISQRFLGDASRFPEIARLNNIADPDLIFPGQRLLLPSTSADVGSRNLVDLVILSELFGDGGGDLLGGNGDTDLEDLIVLDLLFSGSAGGGLGLFR